jgi:hypothetical protein
MIIHAWQVDPLSRGLDLNKWPEKGSRGGMLNCIKHGSFDGSLNLVTVTSGHRGWSSCEQWTLLHWQCHWWSHSLSELVTTQASQRSFRRLFVAKTGDAVSWTSLPSAWPFIWTHSIQSKRFNHLNTTKM